MPLMIDTQMTDEWIARVWKDNPCTLVDGGNIRTGPVRLAFIQEKGGVNTLFQKGRPVEEGKVGKFGANVLFPLGADLSVLENECLEVLSNAPWYRAGMGGLTMPIKDPAKMPLKDPGAMLQHAGFQAGARYVIATSDEKPPVYDMRMSPIIEPGERVYSGVWAFATIRAFTYNKGVNKGVGFGLQSVMIIADDSSLGGRPPPNSQRDFGGVKIDPAVQPASYFGESGEAGKPAADDIKKQLFG